MKSQPLTLNVYFPVSKVTVSIRNQGTILAGQEVEVTCEAGSANPPARLQWRYYHCSRIKQYMRRADHSTIMLTSTDGSVVPSNGKEPSRDDLMQDCEVDERNG